MDAQWLATTFSSTRASFTSLPIPSSILFMGFFNFILIHAPNPLHQTYSSSISVFLTLVLLKFSGTNTSPFDTHPKTVYAALISYMLFYRASLQAARARMPFLCHFVFLFWSLLVASLVSLLLPDRIRPFLYVLSIVPFVVRVMPRVFPIVWRKFRDWLDFLRLWILMHLCRNQRVIGTTILPI